MNRLTVLVPAVLGALLASTSLNVVLLTRGGVVSPADPGRATPVGSALDHLELQPDQRAALLECCQSCCGVGDRLRAEIAACEGVLIEALRQEQLDEGEMRECAARIGALAEQLAEQRFTQVLRVRAILTPSQRERLGECFGGACAECAESRE